VFSFAILVLTNCVKIQLFVLVMKKVDLTPYVEKHEFCFDVVLHENVTNDEVRQLLNKY